jgi:uncharacterized membrane protein HdeD (DUF308 family)
MLGEDLDAARNRWWLFLLLGAVLIVLGLLAISAMAFFTDLVVLYFGFLFLIGGVWHIVSAFSARIGGGLFFHLLAGLLDGVVGLLIITHPEKATVVLTALLAVLFLVGGFLRLGMAVSLQYPRWGIGAVSGLIEVLLGIAILIDFDENRVFVIGLFVGLDLLARGISWVITALALRQLRKGSMSL